MKVFNRNAAKLFSIFSIFTAFAAITLAQSGDYKIVVGTIESENAGYKMLVSIR